MVTLAKYITEGILSKKTGMYKRNFKAEHLTDQYIEDFMKGAGYTEKPSIPRNSFTKKYIRQYMGTDSWFKVVNDGHPVYIVVASGNQSESVLNFEIDSITGLVKYAEIIELPNNSVRYPEKYGNAYKEEIAQMVNKFLGIED